MTIYSVTVDRTVTEFKDQNQADAFALANGGVVVMFDRTPPDIAAEDAKIAGLQYLAETDSIVLQHIREVALGLPTSLTNEEYLALEQKRQDQGKAALEEKIPPIIEDTVADDVAVAPG